jgi:ATPase subunit of ABC transporter with duplicated ATPase domains
VGRSKSSRERSAGNRASEERSLPRVDLLANMQLWSAVKRPIEDHSSDAPSLNQRLAQVKRTPAEFERLLQDCGLEGKLHSNAGSLSGGQKRKHQLAIGLVGGSE